MDFHFAKIYPSYKSSTKFPDTNPAGIQRIHIGEYFYAQTILFLIVIVQESIKICTTHVGLIEIAILI